MADPGRSSFGPVVLAGLGSAGLAAIASAKPWIGGGTAAGSVVGTETGTRYPLASAVSLVLLAAWGVLLVTRGRVRRTFAVLALVAAVALLVAVVAGWATLPDTAGDSFDEAMGRTVDTGFTGWFWTSAVCALLAPVPALLAVRRVGTWPEMGSRYDAPGASAASGRRHTVEPDRELWHALDEGQDPTDDDRG